MADVPDNYVKIKALDVVTKLTKAQYAKFTYSGNAAIFAALYIAKKQGYTEVLIPDQGGWLTYKDYPTILGLSITELKTNVGLITTEELSKHSKKILLFQSSAGYFAEQDVQAIASVAKQNELFTIEDVSGSVGDEVMCNAELFNLVLGSCGTGKVVNAGFGGFIATNEKQYFDDAKDIFSLTKVHNVEMSVLYAQLEGAKERYEKLLAKAAQVKHDLAGFDIVHKNKKGVNVVVRFKTDEEKDKLIEYCSTNEIPCTICPRYIRVNEPAVSIEIKRLIL